MFLSASCISQNTKTTSLVYQQGAVLIVGLIMLLIMTLIGVAAVRGTNLQELMAGNARDKQIAFQAAETALRAAESVAGGGAVPSIGVGAGLLNEESKGSTSSFWRDEYLWSDTNKSVVVDQDLKFTQAKPRYVMEKLNVVFVPGSDGRAVDIGSGPAPELNIYRITARGVGLTENSIVYLQSIYRRD